MRARKENGRDRRADSFVLPPKKQQLKRWRMDGSCGLLMSNQRHSKLLRALFQLV
jgi:hypothetical protein